MSIRENEDVYRRLARRLDTVPRGFPATDSGVELRLLARLLTPIEASLVSVMRLTPESAADIALRSGVDPATADDLLDGMADKGLIRAQQEEGRRTYRLVPRASTVPPGLGWAVQDIELAKLFEQYYQETRGTNLERPPAIRRVIPVQEAIPVDLQVHPYEQAVTMLENAASWGVRECICRLWQRSIGKGCDHPLEVCILISSAEGAFEDSTIDRAISKEEALHVLHQAEKAGLVHTTTNFGDQPSNICSCCTCSCGILRGVAEFGIPTAIARSDFCTTVEIDLCNGCGDCARHCQFGALSVPEGIGVVDDVRCVGCGLCADVCPTGALHLQRRPAGENPPIPSDFRHWLNRFAEGGAESLPDTS
jgi:electron transport complex protein RnfB